MATVIKYIRASLNEFLEYVRSPREDITISYKPKSLLSSFCCAVVVTASVLLAVLLIVILLFACFPDHVNSHLISDVSTNP